MLRKLYSRCNATSELPDAVVCAGRGGAAIDLAGAVRDGLPRTPKRAYLDGSSGVFRGRGLLASFNCLLSGSIC
jgi:hypothetical protein